jgi:outer membrane murein-binding lipoprotein Lpp
MKRKLLVLTLAIVTTLALASCASGSKMSRGGCHVNQGYIGYGGR